MGSRKQSHFFAYISKIRWIQRWGMKRNTINENVMEHSWEVATIAHALALIHQRCFNGEIDANRVAAAALYHDCSEVITGDMPSPIKYHSSAIKDAYKAIEQQAEDELVALLPLELQDDFSLVMIEKNLSEKQHTFIKAADTLSAFLKCQSELTAGNREFSKAAEDIAKRLEELKLPEIQYFLDVFAPSYRLTLDELLRR